MGGNLARVESGFLPSQEQEWGSVTRFGDSRWGVGPPSRGWGQLRCGKFCRGGLGLRGLVSAQSGFLPSSFDRLRMRG